MIGEISIGGVYVPALLLFVVVGVIITALASRFLSIVGFYRVVAYRPLTDLALFLLMLAAIVWLTERWGLHA
jgi:hypothetical protein